MNEIKKQFASFNSKMEELKISLKKLIRFHRHPKYVKDYSILRKDAYREGKFLIANLKALEKPKLEEKIHILDIFISSLSNDKAYKEKLIDLEKIESIWPDIEIGLEEIKSKERLFDVPELIPINETRLDLEESIRDYENGCYISAIVLCRRSYEGALTESFKIIEKKEPIEDSICQNCKNVLRKGGYIGIAKLHKWAISKGLLSEKFNHLGFLISELGAGGAHPPLKQFPREKEVAKLTIDLTITILNELYKNASLENGKNFRETRK